MEKTKRKSTNRLKTVSLVLICVAISAIGMMLLNGRTTITGDFGEHVITETLVCESSRVAYPIFDYDSSSAKSLKINAVFEDERLSSISLFYKLDYATKEMAEKSESLNHAAMNLSFYDDGMESDDLEAKYSFVGNGLQMSIYMKGDDINGKTLKYFMLKDIYDINGLSKEKAAKIYNNAGLDCVIKNKVKKEVNEDQKD